MCVLLPKPVAKKNEENIELTRTCYYYRHLSIICKIFFFAYTGDPIRMTCEVRNARPIGEFRWSLKSRPDNNAAGQIDVISLEGGELRVEQDLFFVEEVRYRFSMNFRKFRNRFFTQLHDT